MVLFKRRKVDFENVDYRGSLTQLIHDGFEQINVLKSNKGAKRGAHFHKRSIEAFYVIEGSVEVLFRSKDEQETVVFKKG